MKNKISILAISLLGLLSVTNCSRFDDINISPTAANASDVQPEYFLNSSILGAQMNPDTAERSFVLYWEGGGHQCSTWTVGLGDGSDDDGWTSAYWNAVSGWLKNANTAITVAKAKEADGSALGTNNNVLQVARIWRAYLMSEMSDNFGPLPIEAYQGVNPKFDSQKDVYYYMLAELTDAVSKIDPSVQNGTVKEQDPAYGFNWTSWIKYANSLRMRLAMRMSEVDPAKAKSEFEAAANTGNYIASQADNFRVAEQNADTWSDLTAVMSRPWNSQWMSATQRNLYVGLGGVETATLRPDLASSVKNEDYVGKYYPDVFTKVTNDPTAGYWLDGLPKTIDPRGYQCFYIPGDVNSPTFPDIHKNRSTTGTLKLAGGVTQTIDAKNTWNAIVGGDWGDKQPNNGMISTGKIPALTQQFRGPKVQTYRIFFGDWESYFLLAEAALRGWNVPMGDEAAYNKGIQESFAYFGVSAYYANYIQSTNYNLAGTSAKYTHTTEPGASHVMQYIDGTTGAAGTTNILYPVNDMYKNGTVKNDKLTKIITQKFLANTPWLPLEKWSDQRRLGLPFFPNDAVENPIPTLPALNSGNYMHSQVDFFPQRLRFPSSFRNNDPENYNNAVNLLGGADNLFTPMWWAKH